MHPNNCRRIVLGAVALGVISVSSHRLAASPTDKPKPPVASSSQTSNQSSNQPSNQPGSNAKADPKQAALSEDQRILHVLNRLGFGPRPGDIEKVKSMGLQRYIDLQLNPERIDDAAVEAKLATYTQIAMTDDKIFDLYDTFIHASQTAQAANKKQRALKAKAAEIEAAAKPATGDVTTPATTPTDKPAAATKKTGKKAAAKTADGATMTPQEVRQEVREAGIPIGQIHEQLMATKMLRAVESERQLQEVMVDFWSNHFNIDMRRPPCGILKVVDDREVIRPHIFSKFRDLLGASAKSPAMLVYLDNFLSTKDETAMAAETPAKRTRKPANKKRALANGAAPATAATPAVPPKKKKAPAGLNENYAREIMELHTLGVDGGYTQQDVREVARCFTGWGIASPEGKRSVKPRYMDAGTYHFYPNLHDNGQKIVLGHTIPAGGGEKDAEEVLDILAHHPSTMKHVSFQLCQRLVSDNPPASLIDRCVATWKQTDGDLRAVTRTIVTSPEFSSPTAFRAKIKSPFEYAVSSVRVLGGVYAGPKATVAEEARNANLMVKPPKGGGYLDIDTTSLLGQVGTMGQPLFQYQAPTGYPEDSQKWVSSGALISRLNFALALTANRLTDVRDLKTLPGKGTESTDRVALRTGQIVDSMAAQILHHPLAPNTRMTLLEQLNGPSTTTISNTMPAPERIAALLLGSPEFQRH